VHFVYDQPLSADEVLGFGDIIAFELVKFSYNSKFD
jgi:hypothetical protein